MLRRNIRWNQLSDVLDDPVQNGRLNAEAMHDVVLAVTGDAEQAKTAASDRAMDRMRADMTP